jgi:uncharacterized protein YndB with AHSA1/START domain
MDAHPNAVGAPDTRLERLSDRETAVTRLFRAPPHLVFAAWTKPELLMRWWTPKSYGLTFVSCEADVRTGGRYRFVFNHPDFAQPMAFHGRYLEVVENARLVWTNEEAHGQGAVTTVTFEALGELTRLVMRELYPSKEALDEALASGSTDGLGETFGQLDEMLAGT